METDEYIKSSNLHTKLRTKSNENSPLNKIQKRSIVSMNRHIQRRRLVSWISNQKISCVFVFVSTIFWVCGYVFANNQNLNPIQTNFIRYLTQTLIQIIIVTITKTKLELKQPLEFRLMLLKAVIASAHAFMIAFGQYFLPLTTVHTINSAGIIFILLHNYLIGHIKISQKQIKALLIGITGLVLTISGRVLYHLMDPNYTFETEFQHYRSQDKFVILLFSVCFIFWMVIWAYSIIFTNKATSGVNEVVFFHSIIGFFIYSILFTTIDSKSQLPTLVLTVLFTGVTLTIANYFFTWGLYISENVGMTSMVNQATVVVSYIVSILIYKQSINLISLLGNAMLIGSIYVILVKK